MSVVVCMPGRVSRGEGEVAIAVKTPRAANASEEIVVTSADLALSIWAKVQPFGYSMPVDDSRQLLEETLLHFFSGFRSNGEPAVLATCSPGPHDADYGSRPLLGGYFLQGDSGPPSFMSMLRVSSGQVHFLHYWRALSEALRIDCSYHGRQQVALSRELETLRDSILGTLELHDGLRPLGAISTASQWIATAALVELVSDAKTASAAPSFWTDACKSLQHQAHAQELTLEDVTALLLTWAIDLSEIAVWRATPTSPLVPVCFLDSPGPMERRRMRLPVYVHIYDVSNAEGVQHINKFFAHMHSPLKLGGVFHAGVEVAGVEWSFGATYGENTPGIACHEPRGHPQHHFRQTVRLSRTSFSKTDIADLISTMIEEYPGEGYDLLRRNCCHFADDFSRRIGAGALPPWVHRLARLGAGVDSMMQRVLNRGLLNSVGLESD